MSGLQEGFSLPGEYAARLVQSAGNPEAIGPLLAEDVTWRLQFPIDPDIMPSVVHGRAAMVGALDRVFSVYYQEGSLQSTVHQTISQGQSGAALWSMKGLTSTGAPFENRYVLWVKVRNGEITDAWEFAGTPFGDA
ncbi:nuclear transport factor 2 family protein [Streptomyces sp. NPDC102274]|uniref:nuclear transport factor 2 family protein n=1 Tax=Streptomyces sp. NPDC102274 TaxID=3366151 RepID=UPI003810C311